jgi:ribose transport system substrate-binding protein
MQVTGVRKFLGLVVALAAILAFAAGCGSDDNKSSSSSSSASSGSGSSTSSSGSSDTLPGASAPLSEAKQANADLEKPVNELTPNGEPFDAKAATNGKTVGWVTVTSSIPFTTIMFKGVNPAAKSLGLKLDVCDGKGQPNEWARCFSRFIGQKVDLIVSQSIDPKIIKSSISAANKAGIPVVTTSSNFPGAPLWPGTAAEDPQPFKEVGKAIGDFIVSDSGGKANALLITSNEVYTSPGQVQATAAEFKKYCPKTCKWKIVDVPIGSWQDKIPTVVQSEITSNPDLTYVSPVYDGAVPFAISAVHAKNAQDKVKVVSFNALPDIMKYMKNKDVLAADVGVWVEQHGYSAIDSVARVLAGEKDTPALKDSKLAMRMFSINNVDSLDFNDPASWYGSANLADFYSKQWQLK